MNNLTVQKRIIYSFIALATLFLGCSGYSYYRLNQIRAKTADIARDAVPGIHALGEIQVLSLQSYNLVCRRLLSENIQQNQALIQEIKINKLKVEEEVGKFEKLAGMGAERDLFKQMDTVRRAHATVVDQILSLLESGKIEEARTAFAANINTSYEQFTASIEKLTQFNYEVTEQRDTEIVSVASNTATSLAFLVAGAVILLVLNGVSLIKSITSMVIQIQKSGIQINNSTSSIAATAKQQQATAMEIASTTTEIGATSREISATSKELLRTVNEVTTVAEDTANRASAGQEGLNRMEETMRHVMEAAASINSKLATVSEKAGNINAVVTTITKVADQTNLLSLNAAIEAEKAGEYGRGFSVVATEIRRLADQTAIATLDIEQIVKEMQSAVSAGVMGMDKFSEEVRRGALEVHTVSAQLTQIIKLVQDLTPRFEAVNEGMQAQSTGAQQISEALSQLSESAQQTADSLKLSNQAIAQLTEASTGLRTGISRFKIED